MALSFDLFGTLVSVAQPPEPATAVAYELRARGIDVPDTWREAYRSPHVDVPEGGELLLPDHVSAALESRGVDGAEETVRRGVLAAFDRKVETRPGAEGALEVAVDRGRVGICSNCSVPGLVDAVLDGSDIDRGCLDAVVTSAACGWRKPDSRIFEAVAGELHVQLDDLIHVGDDPETDGGIEDVGGRAILLTEHDLSDLRRLLEGAQ